MSFCHYAYNDNVDDDDDDEHSPKTLKRARPALMALFWTR